MTDSTAPGHDVLPDPGSVDSDSSSGLDEAPVAAADVSDGLSVDECVLKAVEAKERGNGSFKGGENAEACQAYQLAAQYLRRHSEVPAAKEVLLSVQTNLAAAQLRLELWEDAAAAATAVLALDPASVKALFRRGVARARMGELSDAKADLTAVCKADARNRDARSELAAVQERLAAAKEAEKEKLSRLFAGKSLYAPEEREVRRKAAEQAKRDRERVAREAAEEEVRRHAPPRAEDAQYTSPPSTQPFGRRTAVRPRVVAMPVVETQGKACCMSCSAQGGTLHRRCGPTGGESARG